MGVGLTCYCHAASAEPSRAGGSHLRLIDAADMVEEGLCDVLTTDYYYPALLPAPVRLAADGVLPLGAAWRLVSANPARAAALDDRGEIAAGRRADLILVDAAEEALPRVAATMTEGRTVYAG